MNKLAKVSLPIAIAIALTACSGGGDSDDNDENTVSMRISTTNLEALGDDFEYEGWIMVDGTPVTTGTFDIVDGEAVPSSFDLDLTQANAATAFILSIEPAIDTDPDPAATKIIAGDLENGTTDAVTNHPIVFNSDFSEAAGTFIIATPTNGNMTPNQGIWFLDRTDTAVEGVAEASLTLPDLPAGWVYEGWIVDANGPISTGTFTDAGAADSDGAGPAAGQEGAPGYPGQDFVTPATVLTGLTTVISVEPSPDNSPAPFVMKPLIGADIGLAVLPPAEGTDDMILSNESAATLPSAEITIDL